MYVHFMYCYNVWEGWFIGWNGGGGRRRRVDVQKCVNRGSQKSRNLLIDVHVFSCRSMEASIMLQKRSRLLLWKWNNSPCQRYKKIVYCAKVPELFWFIDVNQDIRGRYRYLSHLPLTCEFVLCELDLKPPVLSQDTLKVFSEELLKRKQKRIKKKREERRRERKREPNPGILSNTACTFHNNPKT